MLEVAGLPTAARNTGGCHDCQKYFGWQRRQRHHDQSDHHVIAAVKLMAERGIGAVVVLGADHRIVGILSERDIVQALAEHGLAVLSEPVSQVMTSEVKTCSEDDNIGDLMARMTTGRFRHLPVVRQGRLIGIVSIGDVVKSRVEEIDQETKTLREYIQTA